MRPLILSTLASAAILLAAPACNNTASEKKPALDTPVTQAYTLLDKAQTGRALELLERIVDKDPSNAEARLLLASAYMGVAGVDVLSLHDAFADVLFSKSLSQVFFTDSKSPSPSDPVTGSKLPDPHHATDETRVEKLFESIDEFLNNVRRVTVIFERFPHVKEHQWPLLEQALLNLDQLPAEREVRVYRMFIRLIYLKEVLVTRVIRDPSFGTRDWACQLDLDSLEESLRWISETLGRVTDDFAQVYPDKASPFTRAQAMFTAFGKGLADLGSDTPTGSETVDLAGKNKLKEAFRCGGDSP